MTIQLVSPGLQTGVDDKGMIRLTGVVNVNAIGQTPAVVNRNVTLTLSRSLLDQKAAEAGGGNPGQIAQRNYVVNAIRDLFVNSIYVKRVPLSGIHTAAQTLPDPA